MDIFGNFPKLKGDKEKRRIQRKQDLDFSYSKIACEPVGKMEEKNSSHSFAIVKVFLIMLFCLLISKLFILEITQGNLNEKLARGNRLRPRLIEANRGLILDSNGIVLAKDVPSFALAVYPSDLPQSKSDRDALYQKLALDTKMSYADVKAAAEKDGLFSLDQALIKTDLSHDDALILEEEISGMPGVFIADNSLRQYDSSAGLAHILGYTGMISEDELKNSSGYYPSDHVGKTGLENEYESYLKGTPGIDQIEVDSRGNEVKTLSDSENKAPVSGDNIVLNIDSNLQKVTSDALSQGIATGTQLTGTPVTSGSAIIMNVNTGAVLSMVSLPSYDDNLFSDKISSSDYAKLINDPTLPLFDRSISGTYPPGSISKIILASAGLQNGNITKDTSLVTPGEIKIGDYVFPDWKDHSYESTNVERAIAESNDVFFYALGGGFDKISGLGIDAVKKYWQLFGLGSPTGIDLPGEASGLLPDNAWKEKTQGQPWYIGDTYHASIGQGDLLVTPLQMVRATAVIANGGKLLQPQLVNKIVDPNNNVVKQFSPNIQAQNFISPQNIATVQQGMRMTITDGSARSIFPNFPIQVAGKTGTAQFLDNQKTHAWFECYAPYDNPQIAIVVLVEGGGEGYDIAGPVAKSILNYYFHL